MISRHGKTCRKADPNVQTVSSEHMRSLIRVLIHSYLSLHSTHIHANRISRHVTHIYMSAEYSEGTLMLNNFICVC